MEWREARGLKSGGVIPLPGLGINKETLRNLVKQADMDAHCPRTTATDQERIGPLERCGSCAG